VAEFETELAKMTKDLVQFLETLPDVLERDVTLSPEQIERMHELIASHRQGLYEKIVSDEETSSSD
jgi:predicted RNase H-like nuclease (RuvC/YqgF family)